MTQRFHNAILLAASLLYPSFSDGKLRNFLHALVLSTIWYERVRYSTFENDLRKTHSEDQKKRACRPVKVSRAPFFPSRIFAKAPAAERQEARRGRHITATSPPQSSGARGAGETKPGLIPRRSLCTAALRECDSSPSKRPQNSRFPASQTSGEVKNEKR
jgi:hypothetical protein